MTKKLLNILIVDDYPIIINGLENTLNSFFGEVLIDKANSRDRAIRQLSDGNYDLIFLDINLNGVNMLNHLDEIITLKRKAKVIVFTAYNSDKIKTQVMNKNVNGFLDKNTSIEELEYAIQEVLSGKPYVNQKEDLSFTLEDSPDKFLKIDTLTSREKDVINLIVKGFTNETIAQQLFLSISTIQTHRKNIYKKLDIHSATELIYLHLRYMT